MGYKPTAAKKQAKPTKIERIVFNIDHKAMHDPCTNRIRKGKYAHFCFYHDELLIDENDQEFSSCLCGMSDG